MGAYIYFKTANKKDADLADDILHKIDENIILLNIGQGVIITCNKDIEWAKEHRVDMVPLLQKEFGRGNYKVSATDDIEEELGLSNNEILEHLTIIFERLNSLVEMRYNYRSCAFSGDYFTQSQIDRITNNGLLFSNKQGVENEL